MNRADQVLEDEQLVAAVWEARRVSARRAASAGEEAHRRKWFCGCSGWSTSATGRRSIGARRPRRSGVSRIHACGRLQSTR
jgi:hypothetical protein